VKHEELVENPDKVFKEIFQFLGLKHDNKPTVYIKSTMVHPLDKPTQADVNVKDALRARRPSYEEWSDEQRLAFKRICGKSMDLLGYEIPF
jgi:hypothetical protein